MKAYRLRLMSVLVLFSVAMFGTNLGAADSADHKASITFSEPVEIPGRILPAGTYLFEIVVPSMHVAQIMNVDETVIYGTFFTMSVDRAAGADLHMSVELEPSTPGLGKRVINWFSSGETVGDELVYYRYDRIVTQTTP